MLLVSAAALSAQTKIESRKKMANMFRTIQQQGGNSGPEFLSDHPDPGNRYDAILREAKSLRITGTASTGPAFDTVRSRLAQMPPAPTTQQVARANQR